MSLIDLGKNDISEETQAIKDRLASRDTENAGLRTRLMRREAELEELRATFNETVHKLSKEAERALQLEEEVSARSSELKTERISLQNTELALRSAQEKLRAEERAKRELESTLDTVSLHSQATSAEHQSVQREKHALESRVRELERIVQTHESKGASNVPRKNGRPRSSSVSNFRLPAVEQELNDVKAQLHNKDTRLRVLEQKLIEAQNDLVKAENARISIDKASQERISELLLTLERKEEEVESLREEDNSGEREEQLLKRIDEDAAKIAALEKSVTESQAARTSQARIQKLQSHLKAEREKVQRNEDLQNRLLQEKAELLGRYEASQRDVAEGHELLMAHERRFKEMESKHAHLLAEVGTHSLHKEPLSSDAEQYSSRAKKLNSAIAFPDESALADQIQTLLQAIDRLRDERDGLKRALAFSEVEYRITTESFQTRIASLTRQLTGSTHDVTSNTYMEQKMKRLTSCAAAFTVVISNLQTRLDLSKDHLSSVDVDLASSNSQLCDALTVIDSQKQSLMANTHEHDVLLQKLDVVTKELTKSEEERGCLHLQLADVGWQVAALTERAIASDAAREEAHQDFLLAEQRFATLDKNCHDVESERNSLALQITNLQDDLARLQNDLADTQNRYDSLHAQQLSEMTASEVVRALNDRIKELESRVVHCNDQIGDYQYDIRRLEANIKLQEERTGEMTLELELLASQKEAMVEDCAEAREARDGAIERSEAAEEKAEQILQLLQQAKYAHEAELSAMSSTVEGLTSEKQRNIERIASLEIENTRLIRELDDLSGNYHRLSEHLDTAVSRPQSPILPNSKEHAAMQQAVISLAVIHRVYRDCARRLRRSHQHNTFFESQLDVLMQEQERKRTPIDNADVSTAMDRLQDDSVSPSRSQVTTDDPSCMCAGSPQRKAQQDHYDVDSLRNSLQEKELELVTVRQSLGEAKSRYAEVEAGLLERIATMTMELHAQAGHAEDIISLRMELESVRTQLQNSTENFADLEELHADVIQDFISVKNVFERRLTETDEEIRKLEADHQRSLTTVETKYRQEADVLTSNLEDRGHDMEKLREQLRDMSEAHTHLERKLHEELKAYEASHALANDLEDDLRRIVIDMRQQLAQSEAETLSLQEERQILQERITGLQAETQRSASLTRYLESQVRESEDACMSLKERLQRSELTLAESEKAGKAAEFNLALQATQHEKVVAALRREIASLQCGPELRSAFVDLEEKNREMDDLLRAKCQEIEEYDDRILETLKSNKRLTSKVESLTRKVQALQTKLSMKKQSQEPVAEATPPQKVSPTSNPPIPRPMAMDARSYPNSSHIRENLGSSLTLRSKTPEPRLQPVIAPPPSRTPGRTREPAGCELSAGKKRPAPDDDERDSVPAEGHYSADVYVRNGPTPRLRRAHGYPGSFTPVRGASLRKPAGLSSPGRRGVASVIPSEVITDVTNSPRGTSGQGDAQLQKRGWLGKIRGGQPASSRLGAFGGQ